jgi:Tfp pilus assembly protein PilV
MLTRFRKAFASLRSDEGGFTLMELLVAMVAGVAVTGALFGVLEVSLHQTARLTDRVQATQLGRVAMTRVVDALHSTCISPEFRPVLAKSNETELWFVNAYSNQAVIPMSEVSEHKIAWSKEAGKETGMLTDYSFPATGGSWPKYTFAGTESPVGGTRIATNIAPVEESGKKIIFQYYKYNTSSTSSTLTPLSTIEMTTPLEIKNSAPVAESVASVLIRFTAFPTNGNTALNRGVEMRNQVTLAMSAPSSETPVEASPCE